MQPAVTAMLVGLAVLWVGTAALAVIVTVRLRAARREAERLRQPAPVAITDEPRVEAAAVLAEADGDPGVRDLFLGLARRSQVLLHRQLGLLDGMQRRTPDPDELAELFRIDHLATRIRRHTENLIMLADATPGRAWRRPVPMIDILRAAQAEVDDYPRVTIATVGPADLAGRAVGDVIHLLAELIENAIAYSPPHTAVRVTGSLVGTGYAVEISDRGPGMSSAGLDAANAQLREPRPETGGSARLGLYLAGRLAATHGIRVHLCDSPEGGGTTAVVLLPTAVLGGEAAEPGLDAEFEADAGVVTTPAGLPWRRKPVGPRLPADIEEVEGDGTG
jgi:signal transduction histidine kinase